MDFHRDARGLRLQLRDRSSHLEIHRLDLGVCRRYPNLHPGIVISLAFMQLISRIDIKKW